MYLERVLDSLSKEKPQKIFLSLSPFGSDGDEVIQDTFTTPEEIDNVLMNRYMGKKMFKVGAEERVVYQRVSHLKRISVNQSTLYNFCSEGAFAELGAPVTLFKPSHDQSINLLWH